MTHHVVHVTAVHLRHLLIIAVTRPYLTKSHSTGLDNEVIEGHLDGLIGACGVADLADILVQASTQLSIKEYMLEYLQEFINITVLIHVVVGNGLL